MIMVSIGIFIVTHPGAIVKFLSSLILGTLLLGAMLYGTFVGIAYLVF